MQKDNNDYSNVKLSQKERIIEFMAVAIAILLLVGCFLKIMFF